MSPAAKLRADPPAGTLGPDGGAIVPFPAVKAWAAWLKKNHAASQGLWIRFYKKDSGVPTLSYAEALDEALCWGWIDGQVRSLDALSWIHRFSPRRPRSTWSKLNRDHVARLSKEGRMRPAGLAQVDAAKADGRWERAYESPSAHTIPGDFREALAKHKKAEAFFLTLNRANLYAISYRLQTAKKPETRARRFEAILAMLRQSKKFH